MKLFKDKKNQKGFFIALAVCLVAIGGVAVVTLTQDNTDLPTEDPAPINNTTTQTKKTEATKQVGQIVTDIPDERPATTTTTTTPTTKDASTNPKALFVLPLTNEVVKTFSDGKLAYSETMKDWRAHNGVDFKGAEGQEVKVIADGKITSVVDDPVWGKTVIIDHGFGILSKYCGVTTALKENTTVTVGQILGSLSGVPCEAGDGPHLHLEITVNGEYVNPVDAIGAQVKVLEAAATTSAQTTTTTAPKK